VPSFRPSSVRIHPDVQSEYDAMEVAARAGRKPQGSIWKAFQTAVLRVKADAQWGEVIPRSGIPNYFTRKYDLANLYCVDLGFHRCFYTIDARDVIFLDIVDHGQYDKWFKVRKK
jgi:hypothetical protein